MIRSSLLVFAALLCSALALAQQSAPPESSLPAAPSATLQQKKPKPAPPPPPAQPSAQPTPAPANQEPAAQAATPATPPSLEPASPPPADDQEPPITIRKRVDEVNLVFTVVDKHGRFVKDLTRNDFRVLDDNKPPTAIVAFSSETNLPLRVGLLVDASNSVRDRFRFEQEAAIEFLNSVVRPRSDQAFVIGFDTTAEVTQDFTDSTERLSHGVRMLRAGGGTALYDAVYFACHDKLLQAEARTAVRRAIILLSDGNDNQSRVTREEAIEMAQRAEVIIYAISTNISGIKERGDKVLERMAEATGGRAFFPFKIQDVANAFADIQDELRSQYLLAYKPADFRPDGRFRAIDIVAQGHKSLKVRARKGYYAPTQ